jgi:hypothetical protein
MMIGGRPGREGGVGGALCARGAVGSRAGRPGSAPMGSVTELLQSRQAALRVPWRSVPVFLLRSEIPSKECTFFAQRKAFISAFSGHKKNTLLY